MVSKLRATDIPLNQVDVLHILALNEDDLKRLSSDQIAAIRRIYYLDDNFTVEQIILANEAGAKG
jgi:hypothetical protein